MKSDFDPTTVVRFEGTLPNRVQPIALAAATFFLVVLGLVAFGFTRLSAARVLPTDGAGQWIRYPAALNPGTHRQGVMVTAFYREFELPQKTANATLELRGFRHIRAVLNDHVLASKTEESNRWTDRIPINVAAFCQPGMNRLTIEVSNDNGPPALWASFVSPELAFRSDGQWTASLMGAVTLPAISATALPTIGPGNPLYEEAKPTDWGSAACVLILSSVTVVAGWASARFILQRLQSCFEIPTPAPWYVAFGGIAVAWAVLLVWNSAVYDVPFGFDIDGHLEYIRMVRDQSVLPLANQGWETHHPPFYYFVASVFSWPAALTKSLWLEQAGLRLLGWLAAMGFLAAVGICLELILQNRITRLMGLLFAATLPMLFIQAHAISNDLLAVTLATAGVAIAVWALRRAELGQPLPGWVNVVIGLILGLGILTKLTVVPIAGTVIGVVGISVAWNKKSWLAGAYAVACSAGTTLVVCGWFFVRNYLVFGRPFIGNFDPESGFRWWQDPGVTAFGSAMTFGTVFFHPFHAAITGGVWDGLYSTFWGDGGWSGSFIASRPPWNYELMRVSYWLSLVPSGLILIGAIRLGWLWLWRPRCIDGLFLLLPFAAALAFLYQYVQFPYYGTVKALYAFPAVISIVVFFATGYAAVAGINHRLSILISSGLAIWGLATVAAFVICPLSVEFRQQAIYRMFQDGNRAQAFRLADSLVAAAPSNSGPQELISQLKISDGQLAEARGRILSRRDQGEMTATLWLQLGQIELLERNFAGAAESLENAVRLSPESSTAVVLLSQTLAQLKRWTDAETAIRYALRCIPDDPGLHQLLATVLLRSEKPIEAIRHFNYALAYEPRLIPSLTGMAIILASHPDDSVRNGDRAVELAQQASRLARPEQTLSVNTTLAASLAETGQFAKAIAIIEQLQVAARRASDATAIERLEAYRSLFSADRPLRLSPDELSKW